MTWLLLVYTIPSQPSGKRAAVWRQLKKLGAIYLRDGVAALPERETTLFAFAALAARILDFGGQATVVKGAKLDLDRNNALIAQARAERAQEYAAIADEATRFRAHIAAEQAHRACTPAELNDLAVDFGKLRHWLTSARSRDYFGGDAAAVARQLDACTQILAALGEQPRAIGRP